MKIIDPDHPFFAPLWRRWATVCVASVFGVVEVLWGNPGLGVILLGMGGIAFYALIFKGPGSGS